MSGCTGDCNQGRNCTCFQGQLPRPWVALSLLMAALGIPGLAVAWGFFWGFVSVAKDCEAGGSFCAWGVVYECSVKGRP